MKKLDNILGTIGRTPVVLAMLAETERYLSTPSFESFDRFDVRLPTGRLTGEHDMQITNSLSSSIRSPYVVDRTANTRLTWLPVAAAALTFLSCNGVAWLMAALSIFGITVIIDPSLQAAAISLFAALTTALTYWRHRVCWNLGSVLLAVIGGIVVVGTMYVSFNKLAESLGLLALATSSIWSWRYASRFIPTSPHDKKFPARQS